jgi:hypothetical protein
MKGERTAPPILKKRVTVCPDMDVEIFVRCADFAITCVRGAGVLPE